MMYSPPLYLLLNAKLPLADTVIDSLLRLFTNVRLCPLGSPETMPPIEKNIGVHGEGGFITGVFL